MYDICLKNFNEEVGGFHVDDIKISELLKIIEEEYPDENITSIQIGKLD